jgi:hypothetical protein
MVGRLLYIRITKHSPTVFHTLNAALLNNSDAWLRGVSLSGESAQEIYLQLHIFTLFRRIVEMIMNSDHNMLEIVVDEFLYNLETYSFLDSISRISVVITKQMINKKFTKIESSERLLIE